MPPLGDEGVAGLDVAMHNPLAVGGVQCIGNLNGERQQRLILEARKVALAAHEKAGLGDHFAVYHLTAGGDAGTYVIFLPMKSLAELDAFPTVHGKAYKDALGEDGQKKLGRFLR